MTRVKQYSEILVAVQQDKLIGQLPTELIVSIATTIFIDSAKTGFSEPVKPVCDPATGSGTLAGVLQDREKESGEGPKGVWIKFTYTIDGRKFSTFDTEVAKQFSKINNGDKVEVSLEKNGQFENITSVKLAEPKPKQPRAF